MIINKIKYSKRFRKELKKLPWEIVYTAGIKENIFKKNPLHPSLRLHELHGKLKGVWTISVTGKYRIAFKRRPDGEITFISIGTHDIHERLI